MLEHVPCIRRVHHAIIHLDATITNNGKRQTAVPWFLFECKPYDNNDSCSNCRTAQRLTASTLIGSACSPAYLQAAFLGASHEPRREILRVPDHADGVPAPFGEHAEVVDEAVDEGRQGCLRSGQIERERGTCSLLATLELRHREALLVANLGSQQPFSLSLSQTESHFNSILFFPFRTLTISRHDRASLFSPWQKTLKPTPPRATSPLSRSATSKQQHLLQINVELGVGVDLVLPRVQHVADPIRAVQQPRAISRSTLSPS